jgi:hypothetical protein
MLQSNANLKINMENKCNILFTAHFKARIFKDSKPYQNLQFKDATCLALFAGACMDV